QYVMIRRFVLIIRSSILNTIYSVDVLNLLSFALLLQTVEANMRLKLSGPDYKNMDPDEALNDFRKRVVNYEKAYEPISEEEEQSNMQYCKLINVGKKVANLLSDIL